MNRSEVFPKGIPTEGYYVAVATNAPSVGLTAYNLCRFRKPGAEPYLVSQVVVYTLSVMEVA